VGGTARWFDPAHRFSQRGGRSGTISVPSPVDAGNPDGRTVADMPFPQLKSRNGDMGSFDFAELWTFGVEIPL
jgi:hypothetical protein